MAAALTIAVLMALSVMLVRVASVVMRLTGLPDNVARFQCMSALTGTGFTTHESEMIVNYPIRRRVLVVLMVLGNLGLVSVGATVIVAVVDSGADGGAGAGAIAGQVAMLVGAVAVILVMSTSRTLDRLMCGAAEALLRRTTELGARRFRRVLQLDDGYSIVEHVWRGEAAVARAAVAPEKYPLTVLAVRSGAARDTSQFSEVATVAPGDVLICYGSDAAHDAFEAALDA